MSGGVFTYGNPPVIRWGPGSLRFLEDELARLHSERPAIVTTRSVASNAEVMDAVRAAIGGVKDPPVALIGQHAPAAEIDAAVDRLGARRPDVLVSVGGGSPIDAAKIVAFELARSGEEGRRVAHLAIPTTLSVAELAPGAGMTDAAGDKVGRREAGMLPDAVIYDGELVLHTPMPLWLSSGIRALDHAVEGYLAPGEHPFSDVLAADAIRRLFDSLPRAREAPMDAGTRTENQLGAWFGYTLPGPTAAALSHVMGKQIGARHGIPHGVTSCLLLPHVLRYRARKEGDRADALAHASGLGQNGEEAAAAIESLIERLGLPHHLAEFALTEPDITRAAQGVGQNHPVDDLIKIYQAAW